MSDHAAAIDRYRHAIDEFVAAFASVGDALDVSRDGWTPRQVVHHLADAELRSTVRLRQLLAEDDPVIQAYDEEQYTQRLTMDRSISVSLEAVRVARDANLELLTRLRDEDWTREGTHTESGPYTLEDWLRIYTAHPLDHAAQVRAALTDR